MVRISQCKSTIQYYIKLLKDKLENHTKFKLFYKKNTLKVERVENTFKFQSFWDDAEKYAVCADWRARKFTQGNENSEGLKAHNDLTCPQYLFGFFIMGFLATSFMLTWHNSQYFALVSYHGFLALLDMPLIF